MCAFAVPVVAKGFPFATAETAQNKAFGVAVALLDCGRSLGGLATAHANSHERAA